MTPCPILSKILSLNETRFFKIICIVLQFSLYFPDIYPFDKFKKLIYFLKIFQLKICILVDTYRVKPSHLLPAMIIVLLSRSGPNNGCIWKSVAHSQLQNKYTYLSSTYTLGLLASVCDLLTIGKH